MADFADLYQREFERAHRAPSARANKRAHDELRGSGNGPAGNNNFMRSVDNLLAERERDAAHGALLDAKDELRRLKREHAHRDDIADAREDVEDARAAYRATSRR